MTILPKGIFLKQAMGERYQKESFRFVEFVEFRWL